MSKINLSKTWSHDDMKRQNQIDPSVITANKGIMGLGINHTMNPHLFDVLQEYAQVINDQDAMIEHLTRTVENLERRLGQVESKVRFR